MTSEDFNVDALLQTAHDIANHKELEQPIGIHYTSTPGQSLELQYALVVKDAPFCIYSKEPLEPEDITELQEAAGPIIEMALKNAAAWTLANTLVLLQDVPSTTINIWIINLYYFQENGKIALRNVICVDAESNQDE